MTLEFEDANSKLVDVVSVADEDRVGNNLLLKFGQKAKTLRTRFGQEFEVEVRARYEAGVWPAFFCLCFVEVMLILVEILKLELVKILNLKFYREADVWLRF